MARKVILIGVMMVVATLLTGCVFYIPAAREAASSPPRYLVLPRPSVPTPPNQVSLSPEYQRSTTRITVKTRILQQQQPRSIPNVPGYTFERIDPDGLPRFKKNH